MRGALCAAWFLLAAQTAAQPTILDTLGRLDIQPLGSYSAIWGYVAPDGREYALLGVNGSTGGTPHPGGTSIIDITNADSLREVAFIPGPVSSWREMKTFREYAYVVSEGGGGVQIINLSRLPDSAWLVRSFNHVNGARNTLRSHTVSVHDGTLYLNGCANWAPGGALMFDLRADPENPVFLGEYAPEYFHDVYVLRDTLYGSAIYGGGGLVMADVRNKSAPQFIGKITYTGSGTHNAWVTKGRTHVITTDEIGTTAKDLKVWDITGLPAVPAVPSATFTPAPTQIVHNVTVRGDFAYVAWYSAGVRVVNIANPAAPADAGGFDTSPTTSGYNGVWGIYPWFPSGKIVAGDMQNGLWVFSFSGLLPRVPVDLLAPVGGTVLASPAPVEFRWRRAADPAADPHRYRLVIEGPGVTQTVETADTSASVTLGPAFQAGASYAWHVLTTDEVNDIPSTDTLTFGIATALAAPGLLSPADGAGELSLPVTLRWSAVQGAPLYDVEVALDTTFTLRAAADSVAGDTTVALDLPYSEREYSWRVRARNGSGAGPWSQASGFSSGAGVTRTYPVTAGWNLLSLPLDVADAGVPALYPGASSGAFLHTAGGGYVGVDTLFPGAGHWVKFPSGGGVTFTGTARTGDSVEVEAGWNIIGGLSEGVAADSVLSDPPGLVLSSFFGYTMGYSAVPVLDPGQGYWVKCAQPGLLVLRRPVTPPPVLPVGEAVRPE
jgi:choice-of-anchor B domain-containing protein